MKLTKLTLMKPYPKFPSKNFLTGILIVATGGALLLSGSTTGSLDVGVPAVKAAPVVAAQDELQLQLGANGFTPGEVQRAAGTFAIAVENCVISGEYTLQLKAHDGTVLKEVQVHKGSAAWTITLASGEYTLVEANHPQWVCRITVQ